MSCTFQIQDNVLWSPAIRIGHLFKGQAEAAATAFRLTSGLDDIIEDECEIDLPIFEKFVTEMLREYSSATHPVLRALTRDFIAAASVLVERAGGRFPDLGEEQDRMWDQLRQEYARSMPR
ncbi:DUF6086 family protein [Kitasatospora sp. NBC_01250]|uniref:DUF6086 family protein n=1 Tax=Kitasatospora sp. NBC_01250 TaxID=2903571 RepID=UPI002E36ECCA|nr:DUF6086 family protein [Kitasatospora sp. NBC_01250]